jgi:hypothetical protein
MWNNQLSTDYSKKLINDAQLHGINYLISDAYWYDVPNGKDSLPSEIKSIIHERTWLLCVMNKRINRQSR